MTAATAARYPLPSDVDDVAPDLAATTHNTNDGTLPTHRGATVSALQIAGDPRGDWRVQSVGVTVELEGVAVGDVREFADGLQMLIDAGRDTVADEIRKAEAGDPRLDELLSRAAALSPRLDRTRDDLAAAEREIVEAGARAVDAVRAGSDPTPHEDAERDATARVAQLKRRLDVITGEARAALGRVDARREQIAKETRAALLASATATLDDLSREVAEFVFARLTKRAELVGIVNAVTPSR